MISYDHNIYICMYIYIYLYLFLISLFKFFRILPGPLSESDACKTSWSQLQIQELSSTGASYFGQILSLAGEGTQRLRYVVSVSMPLPI